MNTPMVCLMKKMYRGDEIEVETWIDVVGKNGTRRDWIIRDRCTKEIIAKATRSNIILSLFS